VRSAPTGGMGLLLMEKLFLTAVWTDHVMYIYMSYIYVAIHDRSCHVMPPPSGQLFVVKSLSPPSLLLAKGDSLLHLLPAMVRELQG
jgi:hypothetical protein